MTEGRTPIDVVDAVRRQRGLEPINPFKIDGAPLRTDGDFGDEAWTQAADPTQMPASPLVPPSVTAVGPTLEQVMQPQQVVMSTLMVADSEAVYRGHAVKLDAQAQTAIAIIVLRAEERERNNLLGELQAPARRHPRTKALATPIVQAAAPKRKGRPKGSKNKAKVPDAPRLDADQTPE